MVDGTGHGDEAGSDKAGTDNPEKAKFQQALARKREQAAARGAGAGGGGAKIHGEHGAAGGKRTFRRRSGG